MNFNNFFFEYKKQIQKKMKLPLFYPFLIFLVSNLQSQINSFTTTQSFEAYISKEVFMNELKWGNK